MDGVVLVGGLEAAVWEGQRCGYRGRSLRSEDGRRCRKADGMERVRVAAF